SATDPDAGDTMTYSIVAGAQPGMSLDGATGAFAWTPSEAQDGTYSVTFRAADPHGAVSDRTVTITVNEANTPPSLTDTGGATAAEGARLAFTLSASDPDVVAGVPDAIAYSIVSGAQPGMALNPSTGAFSWTPSEAQDGTYSVTFRASDPHGGTADRTVTI